MQSQQLPTESQIFVGRAVPRGAERAYYSTEEMSRSDTIMARIVAEKSNRALRQVIHFAGVRGFGEVQPPSGVEKGNLNVQLPWLYEYLRKEKEFWAFHSVTADGPQTVTSEAERGESRASATMHHPIPE